MAKQPKISSPNIRVRAYKQIPATLETLFDQANFIIEVKENQRVFFKTNCIREKDDWWGWFLRNKNSETGTDLTGKIEHIKHQLFEQYAICNDDDIANLILEKLLGLRSACIRLRDTTYMDNAVVRGGLRRIITAIEVGLPEEIRIQQGIPRPGSDLFRLTPFSVRPEERSFSGRSEERKEASTPRSENGDTPQEESN